jgi:hypothetical protein
MSKLNRLSLLPVVLIALAACTSGSGGASSQPSSGAPSAGPSSSPEASAGGFGEIEHATGATDVLLRFETGGGFVPPSFLATEAPIFTLYGDGTVVFRNPTVEPPPPTGSVYPLNPFRTLKLTEDQIQEVLAFALGDGGLGAARASYENQMISDAPTSVFTVNAGGIEKAVSIYALGMDVDGGADAPARAAFQRLAERLGNFDGNGTVATEVFQPTGYRGVLMDGQAAPDQIKWPWADLTPDDFTFPADPNAFQRGDAVLTQEQVDALGLKDVQGGFQGLTIESPDGSKVYSFVLRPLLPGETA